MSSVSNSIGCIWVLRRRCLSEVRRPLPCPPVEGMVFELVCDIPGEFPFVNHGFGHGQKGAIGFLVVE